MINQGTGAATGVRDPGMIIRDLSTDTRVLSMTVRDLNTNTKELNSTFVDLSLGTGDLGTESSAKTWPPETRARVLRSSA